MHDIKMFHAAYLTFPVTFMSNKITTRRNSRALDKREFLVIIKDNFCYFCIKTYVVTPHLKRLNETHGLDEGSQHMVLMRNKKKFPNYHEIPLLSRALAPRL